MYVYMSELECRVATTHKHETEKRREGERERGRKGERGSCTHG